MFACWFCYSYLDLVLDFLVLLVFVAVVYCSHCNMNWLVCVLRFCLCGVVLMWLGCGVICGF